MLGKIMVVCCGDKQHHIICMTYQQIFEDVGLAKNEAKIYEVLLREGEIAAGSVAEHSGVHRRSVYDALDRLVEKGLVFEIVEAGGTRYQAVDPKKLRELLGERQEKLETILPDLAILYENIPNPEALFCYRGIEGWKNYLSDVLQVGKELRIIAATDSFEDERIASFMQKYYTEMKHKKISSKVLFRHDTKCVRGKVAGPLAEIAQYRVLSHKYPVEASVAVYGDRVAMFTDTISREMVRNNTTITIIINTQIANSMRYIFDALWGTSEK